MATVDATTTLRLSVRAGDALSFEVANHDQHTLGEQQSAVLDTVAAPSVALVRVKGFEPGVQVCMQSLAVGQVVPGP